jgi:hypothetical protein
VADWARLLSVAPPTGYEGSNPSLSARRGIMDLFNLFLVLWWGAIGLFAAL